MQISADSKLPWIIWIFIFFSIFFFVANETSVLCIDSSTLLFHYLTFGDLMEIFYSFSYDGIEYQLHCLQKITQTDLEWKTSVLVWLLTCNPLKNKFNHFLGRYSVFFEIASEKIGKNSPISRWKSQKTLKFSPFSTFLVLRIIMQILKIFI